MVRSEPGIVFPAEPPNFMEKTVFFPSFFVYSVWEAAVMRAISKTSGAPSFLFLTEYPFFTWRSA
ncbi:MAG TPA: hypothetical protein DEB39_15510 [Planctomycetaceae bacterium]|nr:hypothetical protein [Planctomycetaceae bacterium]